MKGHRFNAAQKLAEVERELGVREHVYPRWVRAGTLDRGVAQRRMNILREIAEDYRAQVEAAKANQTRLEL